MTTHTPSQGPVIAAALAAAVAGAGLPAAAAELPAPTQKMLAELKVEASVLAGMEKELEVPAAWIEGAKKEGKVIYLGTFNVDSWPKFAALFNARYPFAQVEHQRTSHFARADKPLIALKQGGRVIADVIGPVGARIKDYQEEGALMDLRELPNFKLIPAESRAKDGTWMGEKIKFWCMSFNKSQVKKADLPKTWEDLLASKAMRNGNLGITNRPHNWILPLWTTMGEAWTRNFIHRLFTEVKPQLRKEGAMAMVKLNIVGEFHVATPATDYRVAEFEAKGAPLSWHCPEPVPTTLSELVALKGTKAPNTVKLFLNWFLSKEGQLAIYYATGGAPVRDFPDITFTAYPSETRGKKQAVRSPEHLITEFGDMATVWNAAWKGAGGFVEEPARKVKTVIADVKKGGRSIAFKVGGDSHQAKISKSRTKITIGGKSAKRGALKAGLDCEITYAGNGGEAKSIACK